MILEWWSCLCSTTKDQNFWCKIAMAAGNVVSCGRIAMAKVLVGGCNAYGAGRAQIAAVTKNHVELVKLCVGKSKQTRIASARIQAARRDQLEVVDVVNEHLDQTSIVEAFVPAFRLMRVSSF